MACSIDEIIANKNKIAELSFPLPEIVEYIATPEISNPRIVSIIKNNLYKIF